MQRREFFSSLASGFQPKSEPLLRPPYSSDEALFISECKNCEAKCATVCEEQIIKIADDKTPYLSFLSSGCTFCEECVTACDFGVLNIENEQTIHTTIAISATSCISWNSVMCFSCKDPCLENAIVFEGLFKPVIDDDKCTSCGFCISRCPVNSIEVVAV